MEQSDVVTETKPKATPQKYKVRIQEPAEWIERLSVFAPKPLDFAREQRDDDALREKAFIDHAIGSAREGLGKLKALGVPTKRPDDFYAEMLKSDNHMARVRETIEQKAKEIRERAKKRNDAMQRKYKKELKAQAATKSSKRKREMESTLQKGKQHAAKWRRSEGHGEDFDYEGFVSEGASKKGSDRRSFRKGGIQRKSKKRSKR